MSIISPQPITATMRAVRLHPGDPRPLVVDQIETPRPGAGEVLVRIHAAAITRDELTWPEALPATPSFELSGVVAALGPDVEDLSVGDAVFGMHGFDRQGAAAEYTVIPAAFLVPKPSKLDHVQSAAIPLPALSAWQGLFDHGRLVPGERVLINGARGAVGHIAVQLARRHGAEVVETASEQEPVDLVFDTAGGERLERAPKLLRPGGRLVTIAEEPSHPDGVYFVVEPNREQLAELARLADAGELTVAIDSVFALADARSAFERVAGRTRGKVVLRVA